MNAPLNIAYIVLKGMPLGGGIEKYTLELGSRLVLRGHSVIVYTMRHYSAKDGWYKGMRIRTVPSIRTRSLEKLSAAFISCIMASFDKTVNVVHFHAFGPSLFCFIPRLLGKKVVVQGHGIEWRRSRWGFWGKLFLKLSEAPSICFPHVVTSVSKTQQRYISSTYGRDSIYIPTGINPALFRKPDMISAFGLKGRDYILFVGRLVHEKGLHVLIEAYSLLETPLALVIAGDAKYEEAYKKRIRTLADRCKNRIIFTGFVTGPVLEELYSNCAAYILPSFVEGLPTTLLEAMSYGCRCLASNIPENTEAMHNHGLTFKVGDASDLAAKIDQLLKTAADGAPFQEAEIQHVQHNYTWDAIAVRYEQLYLQLTI